MDIYNFIEIIKSFLSNVSWQTVITTILTSAFLSSLVTGKFNLSLKDREYRNEYYKVVLAKRINAYEKLENLDVLFNQNKKYNEKKYHACLQTKEQLSSVNKKCFVAVNSALWISNRTLVLAKALRKEIVKICRADETERKDMLCECYPEIRRIHFALRKSIAYDMQHLHEIQTFLKEKAGNKPRGYNLAKFGDKIKKRIFRK